MTTNTTNDNLPAPPAAPKNELEAMIGARRAEMIAKLTALKTDNSKGTAEARTGLKESLSHLSRIMKEGVVWASPSETARFKLNNWLTDSAGR